VVRRWSEGGQKVVRRWSEGGQKVVFLDLEFGIWNLEFLNLFGIWNLEFGIHNLSCTFAPPKLKSDEKNISAIGKKTQEQAWFQGKNVDQERPKSSIQQESYRKKETDSLRRK